MTKGTTNGIGLVAIDPLYVIAMRKLTSVTASIIIPIKSIRCFPSLIRNITWSCVNMIMLVYLLTFIDFDELPACK